MTSKKLDPVDLAMAIKLYTDKKLQEQSHRSYCVIEVQNIGFSDPAHPSWFTCTNGRDPLRFDDVGSAKKWAKTKQKENGIKHRVVVRTVSEVYF